MGAPTPLRPAGVAMLVWYQTRLRVDCRPTDTSGVVIIHEPDPTKLATALAACAIAGLDTTTDTGTITVTRRTT